MFKTKSEIWPDHKCYFLFFNRTSTFTTSITIWVYHWSYHTKFFGYFCHNIVKLNTILSDKYPIHSTHVFISQKHASHDSFEFYYQSFLFLFSSNAYNRRRKKENSKGKLLRVRRVIATTILSRIIYIHCK
jgi:hypothetical protein